MRSGTFMIVKGPHHRPSLNRSKPVVSPRLLRTWAGGMHPAKPSVPLVLGAALTIVGLVATLSPPQSHAAMITYAATFTNTSPTPATDLSVSIDSLLGTIPITNLALTPTVQGLNLANQSYTTVTLANGNTINNGFTVDIPKGLIQGQSIKATFTFPSTTTETALYTWSYGPANARTYGDLMDVAITAVPEPASSIMAAIATGVGLVIGWNRLRKPIQPHARASKARADVSDDEAH